MQTSFGLNDGPSRCFLLLQLCRDDWEVDRRRWKKAEGRKPAQPSIPEGILGFPSL